MKQFAITLVIIFNINTIQATDYYLSNAGNDSNKGTTEAQAWTSIKRLNSVIFSMKPGDRVFFERGGLFEGTINIQNTAGSEADPIIFGAYGTGENPIIDGTREVVGWTQDGNIWTADCQDCLNELSMLFINEVSQPLGRYPNETYLKSSGGSGKNIINDSGSCWK